MCALLISVFCFLAYCFFFCLCFFFFNDTATTEIYTLSLHDALPILVRQRGDDVEFRVRCARKQQRGREQTVNGRSEEHTSELQSRGHLVCRLLLEKKKKNKDMEDIEVNLSRIKEHHDLTTLAPEVSL